jgi:predicted secreted Zn-dependent protease
MTKLPHELKRMMHALVLVAASMSIGAITAASPASAEPQVKETIAYYNVAGNTPEELRGELNRIGPFDKDGRQFDAMTRWYVNWRYRYDKTEQACGIASVTTEVKVNIVLPQLVQDAAMPAELRQTFETFVAALLTHGRGHGKIGIDIAGRIEDGIAKLPAEPTCDRMGQVANELGQELIREANRQGADYDAQTNHGGTLGARFP